MIKIHLILGAVWALYCFFHSLLAHNKVKTGLMSGFRLRPSQYRIVYNVFALVSLIALLIFHIRTSSTEIFEINLLSNVTAVVFTLTGLGVMLICIVKYFKQLSGLFKESRQSFLQTGGLHKWVRHPLYAGTFLFLIGLVLYWPLYSNALAVLIVIVYTVAGTWLEEKKLVEEFGDEYRQYQRRVPMLLPWFGRSK